MPKYKVETAGFYIIEADSDSDATRRMGDIQYEQLGAIEVVALEEMVGADNG